MKSILLFFVVSAFMACNSGKEKTGSTEKVVPEKKEETTGLALNKGAKWKADSITLQNAGNLTAIIRNAKTSTLADFQQAAADLQAGLDKMISECKMQGDDHEALHHWLEPLIENTAKLKTASNKEEAEGIFNELKNQVSLFPQYFE